MVGVGVVAGETDTEARRLFTSVRQQFLSLVRGMPGQLPPPVDGMDDRWSAPERAHVERMTRVSAVGSPETVRRRLEAILEETQADELILTAHIHDHATRLRSFELASEVMRTINETRRAGAAVPAG
jgi:alkanesulfonate monooxygenase SsuD/methylene tetrahydromethanopterin reductase-like flavin-dependent oxidoreductase (luciferase family)